MAEERVTWQECRALMRAVRASGSHRPIGYFCDGRSCYRLRIRDERSAAPCVLESMAQWEDLSHDDDH